MRIYLGLLHFVLAKSDRLQKVLVCLFVCLYNCGCICVSLCVCKWPVCGQTRWADLGPWLLLAFSMSVKKQLEAKPTPVPLRSSACQQRQIPELSMVPRRHANRSWHGPAVLICTPGPPRVQNHLCCHCVMNRSFTTQVFVCF